MVNTCKDPGNGSEGIEWTWCAQWAGRLLKPVGATARHRYTAEYDHEASAGPI